MEKFRILLTALLALILVPATNGVCAHFELLDTLYSAHRLWYTYVTFYDNYLATGDCSSAGVGIEIIDISNPSDLQRVDFLATHHMTYALDWESDYIYIPASWDGLYVYNAVDPTNIRALEQVDIGSDPIIGVAVRNDIAYVGSDNNGSGGGLFCLNVSDPSDPNIIFDDESMGCAEITLKQRYAYSFSVYNQIRIFDLMDADNPVQVCHFACTDVNSVDVDQESGLLYATMGSTGLRIYQISDPANPQILSTTPFPNSPWSIDACYSHKNSRYVFVSNYTAGITALDVADPVHPVIVAQWASPYGQCNYIYSYHDIVFVTGGYYLYTLRFIDDMGIDEDTEYPNRFSVSQNYPNPFNSSTIIRYSIPYESDIAIEIYDFLGRKVETLYRGLQSAGEHQASWSAGSNSSGIYYFTINADNFTRTSKMTLVK